MLHTTFEATKSLLKTDPSISPQKRNKIIKLMQQDENAETERPKDPPRLLRRKEAAARLSISLRTLDQWARDDLLTKVILPGKTRACGFSSTEIDALASGRISHG